MGSHTREAASITSIGAVKVCLQKIISTRGEGGRGREGGGRGEGEGTERGGRERRGREHTH